MKIVTRLYKVKVVEVEKEIKGVTQLVKELHEIEELPKDPKLHPDMEVNPHADMQLLATEIARDNRGHEKMMSMLKQEGDEFILRVKILTDESS